MGRLQAIEYKTSEEELRNRAATLQQQLPEDQADWKPHHHALAPIIEDPEKLRYYNQHCKREAHMLYLLEQEGSFVLPPDIT